jgi:hypothetical protein
LQDGSYNGHLLCSEWSQLNVEITIDQWYSTGGTRRHLRGYVDYTICITCIMYQQLWGYRVEDKLYLGVHELKGLNTTGIDNSVEAYLSI